MIRRSAVLLTLATALVVRPSTARAQAPIQTIEINQAIGVQKNNHLNFVEGKDTAIRAFLAQPVTVDPKQTSATITRDGALVATLAPNSYSGPSDVVDFLCPTRAACGDWKAGSYVFDVTVNGQRRSTAGTTYRFVTRRQVRVLAVPIRANYNGTIASVAGEDWKSLGKFASKVFPVAADGLVWTTREEFDGSAFDLETQEGSFLLWSRVSKLISVSGCGVKGGEGCTDIIIGFIPTRPRNGTLFYRPPVSIVVASDQDAAATVAHEIAHLFDVGDSHDGGAFNCSANPPPDTFVGKDWKDATKAAQCKAGRVALTGVSGTKVPAAQHPYDVGGRGALGDSAEYMGAGGRQEQFWTSQDTYDWIFDKLAPVTIPVPQRRLARRRLARPSAATVEERIIYFDGLIRSNASSPSDVLVYPWWSFDDETVPDTKGQYMIAAVDAAGRQLATAELAVLFDVPGAKGQPPRHIDQAGFDDYMRFPPGTTKFQFLNGTRIIGELPVSAHAPAVSQISTGLGSVVNGLTSISWTASDADGDSLFYAVLYFPNEYDDPYWLAFDISTPQWTEDFSELPGGDRAQICVWATDRINATFECGPEFRVPFKPPYVYIWPLDNSVFRYGDFIYLEAYVEDPQDGELDDSAIEWRSNISGLLDTGPWLFTSTLPVGQHIITVTATNSAGLKTSKSVSVTIKP